MEKSAKNFILDNLLSMSAYYACTGTVIASLSSYYGFSLSVSNFITGLAGILPVFQFFGGIAYSRAGKPFRFLRATNGLWRFFMPFIFFSVLFPKVIGAPMMLMGYVLGISIYQFACPSQTDWLVGSVEGKVSADYYSVREMFFMLTFTFVLCSVSLTIDRAERTNTQKTGYILIGVLVTALLIASMVILMRLPHPVIRAKEKPPFTAMFAPLVDQGFRRVMLTDMVWCFGNMFVNGFATVYQVQVLKISFFEIMVWSTTANILRTLCTPLMAKLAAKINWRNVLALTFVMMATAGLVWSFTTKENYHFVFPIATIIGNLPYAGMGVGFLQMQVANSPDHLRSIYLSVKSLLVGGATLLGSLACSTLIEELGGQSPVYLRYIFLIGFVIVMTAAALTMRISPEGTHRAQENAN